ncbi:MAG: EexN family lipoprotein [Rhodoferax sp.]
MKQLLVIALAVSISLIAACGKSVPTDTVESLVANLERLKELRAQCKADHVKVGDAVCAAVSEATRRRFMGGGKSPYANDPVPTPTPPARAKSEPS